MQHNYSITRLFSVVFSAIMLLDWHDSWPTCENLAPAQGNSQKFVGGTKIFLGGIKLQYSHSIAVLTSFLSHKKFTWTDFGGIYTHIPPRSLCPCSSKLEWFCFRTCDYHGKRPHTHTFSFSLRRTHFWHSFRLGWSPKVKLWELMCQYFYRLWPLSWREHSAVTTTVFLTRIEPCCHHALMLTTVNCPMQIHILCLFDSI